MANSRISFVSNILIPILTGIITLVLFLLFCPENAGALFYTNMIYTLLLEGFLFGFLSLLQKESKNISGAFYSIISVGAIYYIIFGSGWMIAYSLLLTAILSYKVYIAVHSIIFLLFIIVGSIVTRTDNSYHEKTEEQTQQMRSIRFYTEKMNQLASKYLQQGIDKDTDLSQWDGYKVLGTLITKINHLTPSIFRNDMAVKQLSNMLENCEKIVAEMEEVPDSDLNMIDRKMKRFASNAIDEITLLRNLSRG